jgi:hypothetical protein
MTLNKEVSSGMLHREVWQILSDISEMLINLKVEAVSSSQTPVNIYVPSDRRFPVVNFGNTLLSDDVSLAVL